MVTPPFYRWGFGVSDSAQTNPRQLVLHIVPSSIPSISNEAWIYISAAPELSMTISLHNRSQSPQLRIVLTPMCTNRMPFPCQEYVNDSQYPSQYQEFHRVCRSCKRLTGLAIGLAIGLTKGLARGLAVHRRPSENDIRLCRVSVGFAQCPT